LYTQDPSTHITLEKLQIEPLLSKQEFAKKHPFQTDRFDGIIETIRVSSLDIDQFINKNLIAIEKILVSDLQMEIFRDKNQAFNFKNFPKFPQQSLKSLKQKIEIGEIEFSNTDIIYLEKPIDGTQIGRISITNIQAKVKNLGNSKEWQKSKTVNLTLEAKLYNKAPLFAQLNFPLRTNTFHFSGHLGKTKMNIFNHMSIANSGIKIKDGILKEMTFNIKADLNASRGRLKLIYQDLEISLLKESNQEGKRIIKERKFFNFLANKVILPTENPDEDGDLYYATIAFERNKNKGIFNYLWKSIFSGMKDTFSKGHKIESIQMQIEEGKEADLSKKDQRRLARDKKKKKAESQ